MATVYLAVDSRSGKEVAVKLPHEQILREEGFAARFTREVKSLLKLAHPHIVKVVDVGEFRVIVLMPHTIDPAVVSTRRQVLAGGTM